MWTSIQSASACSAASPGRRHCLASDGALLKSMARRLAPGGALANAPRPASRAALGAAADPV